MAQTGPTEWLFGDGKGESDARYRLLIESLAQAVWETDADGVVVADSPSWRAYTGQTLDEWLGYGWLDAIHPDDCAYAERQWREAMAARRVVDAEFRLRAPDGRWRWTNVRAAPVVDADGHIEKWAGINIDIDARKRAEAALIESEAKFRTLFDTIDEGYCVMEVMYDAQGKAVDLIAREVNRSWEEKTGISSPLDRPMSELLPNLEEHWIPYYDTVVRTGRPHREENYMQDVDRWFSAHYSLIGDPGSHLVAVVFDDITARKKAEAGMKESEERQAFLLKLSDALRTKADADAVANLAIQMLFDKLRLDRCYIAVFRFADDRGEHPYQVGNDRVPPLPETVRLSDFPEGERAVFDRSLVVNDLMEMEGLSDTDKQNFGALGLRAFAAAILRKGENPPQWAINAVSASPRRRTPAEVTLIEHAAERTWAAMERVRAEAALRKSEARFQQFAKASAAGLWIRDADTLAMEFVSPAIATIYGVETDSLLGDVKQRASMIVPEDREIALEHLTAACKGETVVHEFRIQRPSDQSFRWIRNVDFPLHEDGRVSRIGGIAEDITEAKLATEHQGVLLAELQHRVRNIMAITRSIAARSGERTGSVTEYAEVLAGRLLALSRVQTLLTRAANVSVGLRSIVVDEISVQAQHEGQYEIDGADVDISPKAAEVLTLALHELATNALKYGALSAPDGKVTVRWEIIEKRGTPWLSLDWTGRSAARPCVASCGRTSPAVRGSAAN